MPSTFPSPNTLVTPTVGSSSSVNVAPANPQRVGLLVFNPSATIVLWIAPLGTAAAVNGAGSIAVQPLQSIMLGPPVVPPWTQGLNAIASGGGSNTITVLEFTQ